MGSKRLFVGNLFPEVTQDDLQQRFSKFGSVSKIEVKNKKDIDGQISQTFAFIDISVTDTQLSQCISTLANKKWKGYLMSVQQARESFMERLARERKEREEEEVGKKTTEEVPKVKKRNHEDEEFRIVNNKAPKRDYTEEREAFQGFGKQTEKREKYDPLKLFKSKLAGDENPVPVEEVPNTENMGKVENGIVMFEDDEAGKETLLAVNKKYHSSSEEEEERDKRKSEKKAKKRKVKEDIKSAEFKEKMTKRFLEKQKEKESVSTAQMSSSGGKMSANKGKYYEDTSDEEESEEVSGQTGSAVLKTFQSFSNFWQDSDEEEAIQPSKNIEVEEKTDETEVSEDSSDLESDDEDDDEKIEETDDKKIEEKAPVHLVSDVSMPRYDPTCEEHQRFHRSESIVDTNIDVENDVKPNKFFEVKTDLKKVFGAQQKQAGFSFGFSKSEGQNEKKDDDKKFSFGFGKSEDEEAAVDIDSDGDEIAVPKQKHDVASKFGLQLKGKGVPKSENAFFFSEEDPRLEEGLSFFFDTEIDLDKLRGDYNEKRPILSDILRKRARSKAKRKEGTKNTFGKKKSLSWRKGGKRKTNG